MKKVFTYLISSGILLFWFSKISAQQVVANAGGSLQSTSGTISFTLGEVVIDTKSNANGAITQGFHQTKLIITAINNISNSDFGVIVYPNPTSNLVFLKVEKGNFKKINYSLYDANGKLLVNNVVTSSEVEIPFENYSPSVYYLKVNSEGKEVQTFKIVKR